MIAHGNITHGAHKARGTEVIAHNHNGTLLILLASFSQNPGVIDWNGTALTKKIGTGYGESMPSSEVWYLQNADVGAHNLTMQNGADNYIYAHFCIISINGASSDADPFDQTASGSGNSTTAAATLASCDPTSRTYFVDGLNTAGVWKAQTGGAGQTELWDGLNVDNDCSAGYWEDAETAMTATWGGATAWECAAVELEVLEVLGQPTMIRTQGIPTGPGSRDRARRLL